MNKLICEIISEDNVEYCDGIMSILDNIDLKNIEVDKKKVRNISKIQDIPSSIVGKDLEIYTNEPPRTNFEVSGGYKIAMSKKARLNETKVFNLHFTFSNSHINHSGCLAFMSPREEMIFLLPCNTKETIIQEINEYKKELKEYLKLKYINKKHKKYIEKNFEEINLTERCAQSLMHEYGHVLHWRIFKNFDYYNSNKSEHFYKEIYKWCYDYGYAQNISKRIPAFSQAILKDKIYFIKESISEDYRIGLNLEKKNDIFILPNKICFEGDFSDHNLLLEGVDIVKTMVRETRKSNSSNIIKRGNVREVSHEISTVEVIRDMRSRRENYNWKPGTSNMTDDDHIAIFSR